ncbi:hypothetical protein EDC01DRAFT_629378 [Geopyxis carbonaria]|nr:hypothetical protein EDC01DRAFT_629378 [Geopyxis carbonaria]
MFQFMYFCSLCGGPFNTLYLDWETSGFDPAALPLGAASAAWLDSVHVLTESYLTGRGRMSDDTPAGADGGYLYFDDEADADGYVEPHGVYSYTNNNHRDRAYFRRASFAVHAACWALLQRVVPRGTTRHDVYGALAAAWDALAAAWHALPRPTPPLQWLPLEHGYFGASQLWRYDGVNCEEGSEWMLADPMAAVSAEAVAAGGGATTGERAEDGRLPFELRLEVAEWLETVEEVEAVVGRGCVPPGFWRRRGRALGVLWELDESEAVDWRRVLRAVDARGAVVEGGLADVTARNRIRIWSVCRILVDGVDGVKTQMARRLAQEKPVGLES